ncbi:MAG TPA: helix-turn-helix domain-containing protein [Stellaceae bacterium]|nr:helix-turn-helix domain-containing protein [Stellaceae bacterium]
MRPALFDHADFLNAARDMIVEHGPGAVTVGSIVARLKAPTGSFYHRFASRDLLLGELWLKTVLAYQVGFVAAIDAGDGLAAALHAARWARANLDDACLLLLYSRHDFVQGEWPKALKQGVAEQARRVIDCFERFTRDSLGGAGPEQLRMAQFALADVPIAAVRPHLQRREPPPPIVDDLIRTTYRAVIARARRGARPAGARRA